MDRQTAVFGGGCFWCLEPLFQELAGVISVEPGYAGGHLDSPTYEQVCDGGTGHAEVVRIEFDADRIGFRDLLQVFFATHDPTTPNRQGADVGTQYRSTIMYVDERQRDEALAFIEALGQEGVFDAPIVTEVVPLTNWFPAEAWHRRYFERNPQQGYCAVVIGPKVSKFRRQFASRLVGADRQR